MCYFRKIVVTLFVIIVTFSFDNKQNNQYKIISFPMGIFLDETKDIITYTKK